MTNLPDFLRTSTAPRLAERTIANLGVGSPAYLSIAGGRFTLVDAVGSEQPVTTVDAKTGIPYLDCVVIDAGDHESKIYYGKPYDPNAASFAPPDCWSDNGVAPSRNAAVPQSALCGTCEKAVWGSAISRVSGKGIPACSKYQKLALLVPGVDTLFLLRVPPNSLGNLRGYFAKFMGQEADSKDVVTRISFEKDVLGTLTFNAVNYIDQPTFTRREAAYAAKATDTLVGRGDVPRGVVSALVAQRAATIEQQSEAAVRHISAQPEARQEASGPFVQNATFPSTGTAPVQTQTAPPAGGASPSDEPQRRRRRTQAQIAADNAAASQQAAPATSQVAQQAPFRPAAPPNGGAFGIAQGVAPDPALQETLNSIFK